MLYHMKLLLLALVTHFTLSSAYKITEWEGIKNCGEEKDSFKTEEKKAMKYGDVCCLLKRSNTSTETSDKDIQLEQRLKCRDRNGNLKCMEIWDGDTLEISVLCRNDNLAIAIIVLSMWVFISLCILSDCDTMFVDSLCLYLSHLSAAVAIVLAFVVVSELNESKPEVGNFFLQLFGVIFGGVLILVMLRYGCDSSRRVTPDELNALQREAHTEIIERRNSTSGFQFKI